jgi:hypothetical protein
VKTSLGPPQWTDSAPYREAHVRPLTGRVDKRYFGLVHCCPLHEKSQQNQRLVSGHQAVTGMSTPVHYCGSSVLSGYDDVHSPEVWTSNALCASVEGRSGGFEPFLAQGLDAQILPPYNTVKNVQNVRKPRISFASRLVLLPAWRTVGGTSLLPRFVLSDASQQPGHAQGEVPPCRPSYAVSTPA